MKNLDRWVAAYIGMDERRRRENLPFMEDTALRYPAEKPQKKPPKLTLAADNSLRAPTRHALGIPHDLLPRLDICRIVKSE